MNPLQRWSALVAALALSGCAGLNADKEALRITPQAEIATSPVVREALPQPAPSSAPAASVASAAAPSSTEKSAAGSATPLLALATPSPAAPAVPPPALIPPGTLYICTATVNGQVQQTAIEYEPKVRDLCSKHPEMGVCQYEREACRASGGRVHTTSGVEITKQTDAEYDKKVMRVRFRAG